MKFPWICETQGLTHPAALQPDTIKQGAGGSQHASSQAIAGRVGILKHTACARNIEGVVSAYDTLASGGRPAGVGLVPRLP